MRGLFTISCLFVFILVGFVSADIQTTINLIDSENGDFYKVRSGDELSLIFDLTTGESINRKIFVSQVDSLDLSEELFCFEGCNIVPKRSIYRTLIKENDETLSLVNARVDGNQHNQIFNVYLGDKIITKNSQLQTDPLDAFGDREVTIFWFGNISVEDDGQYEFLINISGEILTLEINENDKILVEDNTFKIGLEKGDNKIRIVYSTDKKENINLLWKYPDENFLVIPDENLKFVEGLIKENSNQPQARGFSVSQFPSSYQIDYSVYPTAVKGYYSITTGRIPVLLVHGLHGSDNIDTQNTATWTYWHSVPTRLRDKNNDVWVLFYMPANVSNFLISGMLKNEINDVLGHYSVSKLDVVSHSMGGLVTMGYLSNLGKDRFGNSVSYGNNIRKYVAIGAPAHGAFSANRILLNMNTASTGCNMFARLFGVDPSDKNAQAYIDLAVGSEFTWLLHESTFPTGISYLAITGNEGILCVPDETKESNSGDPGAGNDGLVAVSSASLLNKNIPLIILGNYNHANEIGDSAIYLLSFNPQKEVDVIDSFIKGQSVNTIKSYLENGDYYIDPNIPSSNVFTRGSIVLKIISNNPVHSVKLKNPSNNQEYMLTKFRDLRHNTQTNNWFYFSDNDLSISYSNQKYGLTFPSGNYRIYVNGEDIGQNVVIRGAQTTMQEIDLGGNSGCVVPTNNMHINADVVFCPGNYYLPYGIQIVSSNVVVDCNGAKLFGSSNDGNGIWVYEYSGVTIKNCEISDYAVGIYSRSNALQSNKILSNNLHNNGRALVASNNHEVSFNEVYNNNGGGIQLDAYTPGALLKVFNNSVYNNSDGFLVFNFGEEAQVNINWNEIYENPLSGNLRNLGPRNVDATNNWWGTNDEAEIAQSIYDFYDESSRGIVFFAPFITRTDALVPKIEITNNEFFYNHNDIEFSFNVSDWEVGGKGQDHVHFHVDGIPGLDFSDHLMFYNSPDNVVELNLEPRPTTFASWVNSNTIRINNVPNGLHNLRAQLATSVHTIPPNSEAGFKTDFLVSSTNNIYGLVGNASSGTGGNAMMGEPNAPVTMIMFGGYGEPFSGKFYNETFLEIKSQYIDTGKMNFVFRDFPLVSLYSRDQLLAEIAECHGKSGSEAYYEMFNLLFEKGLDGLEDIEESVLNDIFECIFSGEMAREVIQDYLDAQEMGVFGSPTFFINGEMVQGAQPFSVFQEAIENALNENIECFVNSDCGEEGFIGEEFCFEDNVVGYFVTPMCHNSGTQESFCSSQQTLTIIEICQNGCLNEQCIEPEPNLELVINSPMQKLSTERRIQFNLTINQVVDKIIYINNEDLRPREKTLCSRNCEGYGHDRKRMQSFGEGSHNLTFKAIKDNEVVDEKNIAFLIDSKIPRILRTEPRRGFASGIFGVEFIEDNPTQLTLFYGDSIRGHSVDIENECFLDRARYKCETEVDLEDFDGQEIQYWFNLTDVVGNSNTNRPVTRIKVDTTNPVLNNPNSFWEQGAGRNQRYIYFDLDITEQNFDKVVYIYTDNRGREREASLCSRLRNGKCVVRKLFSKGDYELDILIKDKAGNIHKEIINFVIA